MAGTDDLRRPVGCVRAAFMVLLVLSTLVAGVSVLPLPSSGSVLYVGGSGPGNYTTIQGAIDAASPGDIVFVFSGTYYEDLTITKSISLVGEAVASTIIDPDGPTGGRAHDYAIDLQADDVSVSGFTFVDAEPYHAIIVAGVENARFVRNDFAPSNGGGILLRGSRKATLENNSFHSTGVMISGTALEDWNSHAIDGTNTVNANPIRYLANAVGARVPDDAGEAIVANVTGALIENLNIATSIAGILLGFSPWSVVVNNTVGWTRLQGIFVVNSPNATVMNNTVAFAGQDGVRVVASSGVRIVGNTLSDNWLGLVVTDSDRTSIRNNSVHDNTQYGLVVQRASEGVLANNAAHDNGVAGIALFGGANMTISNNNATANGGWSPVTGDGLAMYYSRSSSVVNNLVGRNVDRGIHMEGNSGDNRVYHNFLAANPGGYEDRNSTNEWDDGYPSGGNHWEWFPVTDDCSGPNQDVCPDADGIVDFARTLDSDSRDRYPLVSPPPAGPRADFDIVGLPAIASTPKGNRVVFAVTTFALGGYGGPPLTVDLRNSPPGITGNCVPTSVEAGSSCALFVDVDSAAMPGRHLLEVAASNGTAIHETIAILDIRVQGPMLEWVGVAPYESDGIDPETGTLATTFTYRIAYRDADGEAPVGPTLHIEAPLGTPAAGCPCFMSFASWLGAPGDYVAGATYLYATSLARSTAFVYYFTATDGVDDAVGLPVTPTNAPDVLNRPPMVHAGPDQTDLFRNFVVALDGTASLDPDGDPLTYAWTQTEGPPVSLSGATTATSSFTPLVVGAYSFDLVAEDGRGGISSDRVTVIVVNGAPTADAGPDQVATVGNPVALAGIGSDRDGDSLSYAWTQVAGPPVTLSDSTATGPSFIPGDIETYTFRLTVTDGHGGTATDTVTVTVQADGGVGGLADSTLLVAVLVAIVLLVLLLVSLARRGRDKSAGKGQPADKENHERH